jgi:hypothetical protein
MKKGTFLLLLAFAMFLFSCRSNNSSTQGSFSADVNGTHYQVNQSKIEAVFQKEIASTYTKTRNLSLIATLPSGYILTLNFAVPFDADSNSSCLGLRSYYAAGSDSSDAHAVQYPDGSELAPVVIGGMSKNSGFFDVYGTEDSVFASITACDESNKTVSGTFRFIAVGSGSLGDSVIVTNGKFTDVSYIIVQ